MSYPTNPSPILGELRQLGVPRLVTLPAATIAALTSQTADPQVIYVEEETGAKKSWNPVSQVVESFSGASIAVSDAIQLDNGSFTYTGPAHYTPDHLGVWRYRHPNVPPMAGARLVYNFMDGAYDPNLWYNLGSGAGGSSWAKGQDTLADGSVGNVLEVNTVNSGITVTAPTIRGASVSPVFNALPPVFFPGRIIHARYDIKFTTLPQNLNGTTLPVFYLRPADDGIYPSESRTNAYDLPAGAGVWKSVHSITALNSVVKALGLNPALTLNDTSAYKIGRVSLDFASGLNDAVALNPVEYVEPATPTGPGYKYFATLNGNTRSTGVAHTTAWDVMNAATHGANNTSAGTLVSALGAAVSGTDPLKGFQQEPVGINLCTADNWLFGIGWGKMSATGSYTTTPPLQGSTNYPTPTAPAERLRYEVDSMARGPYQGFNAQITFVQGTPDVINNSGNTFLTDGWKVGDGVWAWMGNEQADGVDFVGVVVAVTAGQIQLATTLTIPSRPTATGRRVRLMRIPKVGDQVLLLTNSNEGQFRTTIATVVVPAYSAVNTGAWHDATAGIKAVVLVGLSAAPADDGGFIATDNGIHFFYWTDASDFGITITGSGVVDVAYDREAMRAAGLDDIAFHGLCFKLSSTSGNPTFDFGNAVGLGSKWSVISGFGKLVVDNGSMTILLASHGGGVSLNTVGAWQRWKSEISSAGPNFRPRITINGVGTTGYFIGMQFEQSASSTSGSCPYSSPIVNPMKGVAAATQGATRTLKRMTKTWGKQSITNGKVTTSHYRNNFPVNIEFTPQQVLPGITQALWTAGDATNGFAILLGGASGDTWTARKSIAGVNHDSTVTLTPVPGTTYTIVAGWSSVTGTTFSVGGNAGTAQSNTADVTALTDASPHDLGTLAGTLPAFGSLRKSVASTYLLG